MDRPFRCLRMVTLLLLVAVGNVHSFADETSKAAVASAYKRTKTAKTPEDYTEILRLCEEAQQGELSEQMQTYVGQLMSWAHNRRGEHFAQQAAEATVTGEADVAAELDALGLRDFEAAVQLDPQRWKPWLNRGIAYGVAGRHDKAISDFAKVIALKPDQSDAWFNRAEILSEMGRYEESLADYDEAVRLNPEDSDAYLGRGSALFRMGAVDAALAALGEAVLHSDDVAAYLRRADVLQAIGRWEAAAADCRRAIAMDRESAAAYHAAAWLMATCPDERYRDEALALEAAERALELDATRPWQLLDTLAAAKANTGSFAEATELADAALDSAPQSHRSAVQKRLALYRQGQPFRQTVPQTAVLPAGATTR